MGECYSWTLSDRETVSGLKPKTDNISSCNMLLADLSALRYGFHCMPIVPNGLPLKQKAEIKEAWRGGWSGELWSTRYNV